MTVLLDGNVLIALATLDHEHHLSARRWFSGSNESFATCPITQGTLVRFLLRQGDDTTVAKRVMEGFMRNPRHAFWSDSISYHDVRMEGVVGHGQVTDAYLAQLARENGGRLATFDEGLAGLHKDVADLIV